MEKTSCLHEFSLTSNETSRYCVTGKHVNSSKISRKSVLISAKQYLCEAFLPKGYPESVSDDYTSYQIWDSLQACCSTLSGMLAVQSVLLGVGVGQANATPLAAAVAWFTKDGVGMITGITFAWLKGTSLDADCKKWRLFADFVNDVALCMELSISMWGISPVVLLCISSGLKAVVGVAGGATRAVLTQHQAIRGNTADVAAKDGSQETLVNLVTTVFGIGLIHLEFTQRWAWVLMVILVVFHLYCNYRAVKSLKLKTLNEERLWIIVKEFLRTKTIPSVDEVNEKESVLLGFRAVPLQVSLKIGQRLKNENIDFQQLNDRQNCDFLIFTNRDKKSVSIALKRDHSDWDIFRAYIYGIFVSTRPLTTGISGNCTDVDSLCEDFRTKAELAGWVVKSTLLPVGPWRYEFDSKTD